MKKEEQPQRGSIKNFLRAYANGWLRLITGPVATVLFLVIGAFRSGWIRASFFLAAAICFFFASFQVWQDQQEEIANLKKQISDRKVRLHFDMDCDEGKSWLSVSNLGTDHFLLQRVRITREDGVKFDREVRTIIESGKIVQVPLSNRIYDDELYDADFELTLEYVDADGNFEKSECKCFNVALDLDNRPVGVMEGLDALWPVKCPKCGSPVFVVNVHGLTTFDGAEMRRGQVASDLQASCPDHKSDWLLTADVARAQQEERGKRPKSI